jgi:hypothetical protein
MLYDYAWPQNKNKLTIPHPTQVSANFKIKCLVVIFANANCQTLNPLYLLSRQTSKSNVDLASFPKNVLEGTPNTMFIL